MSWEYVKLGSLVELITKGTTPTSVGFNFVDNGINFIKIESIALNGKFIPSKFAKINSECNSSLKRSQLKAGDILFSIAGALGRTAIVTNDILPANTNQALAIIRLQDERIINKEFLARVLVSESIFNQLSEMKGGVAQQNLSLSQIKDFLIPLPPLPIQKKIVAKLDAIFAEIDKATAAAKANAKNAEALFQSYLKQIFEYELNEYVEKSIDDITLKTKNVSPEKSPLQEFTYVDVSSVSNESFKIVSTQKILGKDAPSRAKKHILENDILFATVRPTLKRIAVVPSDLTNQVASTGYVVLRASEDAFPKFIFYYLFSNNFMEQMNKLQKGASYPAVTDSDVKNQRLKVPPLEIQKYVTGKIETVFEKCSIISKVNQSRVNELSAIKDSILKQVFNGELVKE